MGIFSSKMYIFIINKYVFCILLLYLQLKYQQFGKIYLDGNEYLFKTIVNFLIL